MLRLALQATGDIVYAWDMQTDGIVWTDNADVQLGVPAADLPATGSEFSRILVEDDLAVRQHALHSLIESGKPQTCEFRIQSPQRGVLWFRDRTIVVRDADDRPSRVVGTLCDFTDLKQREEKLTQAANFDELTGLYNRSFMKETLNQAIAYCQRYKSDTGLLLIGIDNLGRINEVYGHSAADMVVKVTAERLKRELRSSDILGRIQGNQFGAVLRGCCRHTMEVIASKLIAMVQSQPVATDVGPIWITISIGGVALGGDVLDGRDAIEFAETALARSKRAGQNQFIAVEPSKTSNGDRDRTTANRVMKALEAKRLRLAYQPMIDSRSGELEKYECLLRMEDLDGNILGADEFLPVVEDFGLARLLDRYTMELVLAELVHHPQLRLAVNVSGLTTADATWLDDFDHCLLERPDVAARLTVEITETAALHDLDAAKAFVQRLSDFGCCVSLDDFGTGHWSFNHIRVLPISEVKIDGSFINDIRTNSLNLLFTRSLVRLCHGLNLRVVAECIEDEETAALLRREQVDILQGYLFGQPRLLRDYPAFRQFEPVSEIEAATQYG